MAGCHDLQKESLVGDAGVDTSTVVALAFVFVPVVVDLVSSYLVLLMWLAMVVSKFLGDAAFVRVYHGYMVVNLLGFQRHVCAMCRNMPSVMDLHYV